MNDHASYASLIYLRVDDYKPNALNSMKLSNLNDPNKIDISYRV